MPTWLEGQGGRPRQQASTVHRGPRGEDACGCRWAPAPDTSSSEALRHNLKISRAPGANSEPDMQPFSVAALSGRSTVLLL